MSCFRLVFVYYAESKIRLLCWMRRQAQSPSFRPHFPWQLAKVCRDGSKSKLNSDLRIKATVTNKYAECHNKGAFQQSLSMQIMSKTRKKDKK